MARKGFVFLAMGMMIFFASIASADVPPMISYQGKLTTAAGGCLNDTVQMTFSIYPDTLGSPADWSETQTEIVVKEGIFNVLLGAVDTIPSALFDGSIKYLGVQVEADPEMRPLKPMVSVAYAYRAGSADGGGGGGWVDDGHVVRLETDTDSVGIGTTTPVAKLDVVGDVNINSVYKIGGDAVLSTDDNDNTFVGAGAGSANTTGYSNTFVGRNAGYSNTEGYRNTFVGRTAGFANTTGDANTFLGWKAGSSHIRDDNNTFLGASAGRLDTSGAGNTFVGSEAGYSNTGGVENTFVGSWPGYSNTEGFGNTFLGVMAGYSNTTGYHNTFLGRSAGRHNTTGSNSTALGHDAGYNATGDSNVFIGYRAGYFETGSNKLYIANGWDDSQVLIYGDFSTGRVGIGTQTPGTKLAVYGLTGTSSWSTVKVNTFTGAFYYQSASKRHKEDIQPFEDDFDKILEVQPKSFDDKESGQREIGYIAEEFDAMGLENLVIYDKDGQPDGLKYELVSLYLLEVVKDQVEALKQLDELKSRIEALESR